MMYEDLFYGCGINYPHCKEDCYWYREEQDMCAHIPYCQNKDGNYIEPEDCENCEHYHSKYKKIRADLIRAMTDEELAELLTAYKCVDCILFSRDCKVEEAMAGNKTCEERILDWLREEAE